MIKRYAVTNILFYFQVGVSENKKSRYLEAISRSFIQENLARNCNLVMPDPIHICEWIPQK